jgi:hypothetical protein
LLLEPVQDFHDDIHFKASNSKIKHSNLTLILPSQFALTNASEGVIGQMDLSNALEPVLYVAVASGKLIFRGRHVRSSNKFIRIEGSIGTRKRKSCEIVEEFIVFDEVLYWRFQLLQTDLIYRPVHVADLRSECIGYCWCINGCR